MRQGNIQIGEYQLFCRVAGVGNETVVLMHGIPTNSFIWMPIIQQLATQCRVIAPDLLGYGLSDRVPRAEYEKLSLPHQAEYMIKLLDYFGIQKAHFVGHDLGGGIAQILAVKYPERVASFVVTDGVTFSNWPLGRVMALRYPTAPEFEPSPTYIERFLRTGTYHQELITPDLISALVAPYNHPGGAEELQTASFALEHHQTQDIVPELPNIKVKASFIWGQHDPFLPAYWGYRLNETVPNSTFTIIPQAGHFCMIDNPLLVTEELYKHMNASASINQKMTTNRVG
ncbi:alpha/beta hydrolase [Bacillus sp. T33-2]|nr:alpha/beta hydrolase [Bacillus sp. T33-2]